MSYKPVSITATLSNTVQTTPGFVKLKDDKVIIPFPYVNETDLKVSPENTKFSFANASVLEVSQEWNVNTLPQTITFFRDTSIDIPAAVFFAGSSIRADDLNKGFEQLRFKLEEVNYAS